MSVIRIRTNFNIDLEFPAASFGRRLVAWAIDVVVMIIYVALAVQLLNWVFKNTGEMVGWTIFTIMLIPVLTYHLMTEILMNGQSVGKKILGLKVVNENGGQPGMGQFVIRWLIRTSDIMVLVIVLFAPSAVSRGDFGFVWKVGITMCLLVIDLILVNSRKQQRLGDILAHTLVIMATQKETIHDTVFLEVSDSYVPSFPEVMRLSDRDINSLKGILDSARKRNDYHLAEMASEKIKTHLKIDTSLSPFDFLEVLLKDYNYLAVK